MSITEPILISKRKKLIGEEWYEVMKDEFDKPYFKKISAWIKHRRENIFSPKVYPKVEETFRAFQVTPFSQVKVVILGQDPYYSGVANGIAFATNNGLKIPPSLKVIFDELENDVKFGLYLDQDYTLMTWAKQGVFWLNTILTVESGKPKSHANIGWEKFILRVLRELTCDVERKKVFMLWGNNAKRYRKTIDNAGHLILEASHPQAENYADEYGKGGFLGCRHFSKANEFLEEQGIETIKW